MNKILNWTFGACFRTLGRFLAIFIVGVLLIFIGSKIGIELPDWLALNVKAVQIDGWAETLPALGRVDIKECTSQTTCSINKSVYVDTMVNANYTERNYATIDWDMSIGSNGYVIISPWSAKANYLYNINYYVCFNKNIDTTDINTMYFTSSGNPIDTGNLYISNPGRSAMSVVPIIDGTPGSGFGRCYRYSNYAVPDQNYNWAALRIQSSSVVSGVVASVISLDIRELGLWDEKFEDIINNSGLASAESVEQVQQSVNQVEQEIQQTQDTITNDDTSGAQDSADGFFNDFQSEDFGLSSIVTAPLRGINAMLTDTCVAPSATYKGQTFSLPCGSMLWSRPGGEDFKTFINVMYGGFLAYLVIRKFFLDVETLKNPNSDKLEVDKL